MTKVFHWSAPRETYHCDAVVIWCFDNRFEKGFRKFLMRSGVLNPDSVQIAGGAKSIVSPERETDREFVVDQIRKSMRLHGTDRAILTLHSDCGAYGGLQALNGDAAAEARQREADLRMAAENLSRAIPGLRVDCYFMDFEGIWQVAV